MIPILLLIIVSCLGVLFAMFGIEGLRKHSPKIPPIKKGNPDINENLHPL